MKVSRGDVVLLSAPFTGRSGAKTRPMRVVQNDRNNTRMVNTFLALITTNLSRASEPTQVLIEVNTSDGKQSGLFQDSVVTTENLLTVSQSDIQRRIGHLPDSLMRPVDAALKVSLELP